MNFREFVSRKCNELLQLKTLASKLHLSDLRKSFPHEYYIFRSRL
jgi:hypothetical protein